MEPHIFDCTLSFSLKEGTIIKVVSVDGTIATTIPAAPDLMSLFEDDQYKIKCEGYWDKKERLVWLGSKIES